MGRPLPHKDFDLVKFFSYGHGKIGKIPLLLSLGQYFLVVIKIYINTSYIPFSMFHFKIVK